MLVSVAVSVVVSDAWRGSLEGVRHVVFQLRAVAACPALALSLVDAEARTASRVGVSGRNAPET